MTKKAPTTPPDRMATPHLKDHFLWISEDSLQGLPHHLSHGLSVRRAGVFPSANAYP
jgi:hypothetical protein